jgi:GNAT superfamily N-acetyltransferase
MGREPPTLLTPQCKRSFTAALMPVNGLVPGLPLMRPTFLIRLARVEEAAALSDLGFRSKAVWGYDPEFMALMPAALAVAPEDIAAGDVWIATRADEQIAGVVALAPGDAPGTLDLNKLFVEPRHIRSGVGRALLAHAVAEARQRRRRAADDPG